MMDLLQLKYFCDAAKEENFSRTAKKFRVPASNISQTVKRLETELGVKLFDRSANRIALSSSGKKFYEKISIALSEIDSAAVEIKAQDLNALKEIRIKVCTNRRIVTDAIERFKKIYPEINFFLCHNYSDDGEFDFIISDLPPENSVYAGELLINERFCVAMAKENSLSAAKAVSELKGQRFITMQDNSSHMRCVRELCKRAGFEPNIAITSDDPYYVRRYIEMGLGIGFVPEFSWRGQFSDNVVLLDICRYTRDTYLYYHPSHITSSVLNDFKNILLDICHN